MTTKNDTSDDRSKKELRPTSEALRFAVQLAEEVTVACQIAGIEARLSPAAREAWHAIRVGDAREDPGSRALVYVRLQALLACLDALVWAVQELRNRLVAADPMLALVLEHDAGKTPADEVRHG